MVGSAQCFPRLQLPRSLCSHHSLFGRIQCTGRNLFSPIHCTTQRNSRGHTQPKPSHTLPVSPFSSPDQCVKSIHSFNQLLKRSGCFSCVLLHFSVSVPGSSPLLISLLLSQHQTSLKTRMYVILASQPSHDSRIQVNFSLFASSTLFLFLSLWLFLFSASITIVSHRVLPRNSHNNRTHTIEQDLIRLTRTARLAFQKDHNENKPIRPSLRLSDIFDLCAIFGTHASSSSRTSSASINSLKNVM